MTAETVDFIFNGFLETFHNKKGNDRCRESDSNTGDCNGMNDRGKSFLLAFSDSL
jgi:hypothetical protein